MDRQQKKNDVTERTRGLRKSRETEKWETSETGTKWQPWDSRQGGASDIPVDSTTFASFVHKMLSWHWQREGVGGGGGR